MKHMILLVMVLTFLTSCNKQEVEREYYKNSNRLKYEVPLVNGKRNGIAKRYNKRGKLLERSIWRRGIRHGEHVIYYPNGKVKAIANFSNGVQDGFVQQFDSLGNITDKFLYKDGAMNGPRFEYYDNEVVATQTNYINDTLSGPGTLFNKDGQKSVSVYYEKGEEIYRKEYNSRGFVINSILPLEISESSDSIFFQLKYSDIPDDSLAVVAYLGRLDSEKGLIDTTDYKAKRGLKLALNKDDLPQKEIVQGHFCELKYPDRIEGRIPFSYQIKK